MGFEPLMCRRFERESAEYAEALQLIAVNNGLLTEISVEGNFAHAMVNKFVHPGPNSKEKLGRRTGTTRSTR